MKTSQLRRPPAWCANCGRGADTARVEAVPQSGHWAARELGSAFWLARGWERQAGIARNPLFCDGALTPASYRACLLRNAVRYIAPCATVPRTGPPPGRRRRSLLRVWTCAAPRVILADVSIGGTLAEARHRTGLTVAEVSAHTRIREGLIRAIEQDEFGSCGGDFYARGHIRAIAGVVGADPGALISQYDAEHPSGRPPTMDDLLSRPPSPPPPPRGPRQDQGSWLGPVVLLLCVGVIVFVAYWLTARMSGPQRPSAVASLNGASPRTPAASHGPRPSPRGTPASSKASPRPAPKVTELTPVSAKAFGPGGTSDGDNPQGASLALSGDPATPWHTDWYTTARFGNLQAGTGLLLDLGRTVTATSVTIRLGDTRGADLQVRAGTTPAHLRTVARTTDAGGSVRLRLASHPRARYVLIWFTLLPPDAAGTYQAYISGVKVTASSG